MPKHLNCPVKLLHNVYKLPFVLLIGLEVHPLFCLSLQMVVASVLLVSVLIQHLKFKNKFNSYSSNTKTANYN